MGWGGGGGIFLWGWVGVVLWIGRGESWVVEAVDAVSEYEYE